MKELKINIIECCFKGKNIYIRNVKDVIKDRWFSTAKSFSVNSEKFICVTIYVFIEKEILKSGV